MEILDKNLNNIKDLKILYENHKKAIYQIENAKKGYWTFTINNIYIHSKYDPKNEADKITDFLLKDKDQLDIIILFGNGLGYIAHNIFDILIKNNKSKILPYIILIEADIKIFLTSIQIFDWSKLLNNEHFKLFLQSGKEDIGSFIQSIPTKRIRYYYHRASYTFNEEYFKSIQKYIEYILDRKDMNVATFTRFQKVWTRNIILNLNKYLKTNPLNKLKDTAKGLSCIIVAGGPTVEKYINFIYKNQNNLIIIAVDTVYKFLLKNNINPDILVTIDPQYWNYKYLENLKIKDSIIITDSSVFHKIFNTSDENNFFIGSSIFPILKYFENSNETRGNLAAGGSVATSAFDAARIIGCEKIIFVGLDLSFPNRMTHFKGAFFESRFLTISDYWTTSDSLEYKYLCHVPLLKSRSNINTDIFTDQKMLLFKKWFEREIQLTDKQVITPPSGGIMIEGIKILDLNTIELTKSKNIFLENIKYIKQNNNSINNELNEKIKKFISYTLEIKDLSDKIIALIPEDGKINLNKIIQIENLEKILYEDIERKQIVEIISSSAQDILLSIAENISFDTDQKTSAWIKTRLLYNSIKSLSDFFINTFKKALKFF